MNSSLFIVRWTLKFNVKWLLNISVSYVRKKINNETICTVFIKGRMKKFLLRFNLIFLIFWWDAIYLLRSFVIFTSLVWSALVRHLNKLKIFNNKKVCFFPLIISEIKLTLKIKRAYSYIYCFSNSSLKEKNIIKISYFNEYFSMN